MCINPASHEGKTFACRKCWQCMENRIQDWVGRCIAQSKTSTCTRAVTLTYGGGDHARATVLTYSDVQKFFKRLRYAGFRFKYLVAGEYGHRKGRAHWHAILFFDGPAPAHDLRKNCDFPLWGHGHTFWDEANHASLRYVCKYILKDEDDQLAQAMFRMSKKPPIGTEYFERLAKQYADHRLSPPDLFYRFPENKDKYGKPVQHCMHGAAARDFLAAFVRHAGAGYGLNGWKQSQPVDDYLDGLVRHCPDPALTNRIYGTRPYWSPAKGCVVRYEERSNSFHTIYQGRRFVWRPVDISQPKGEHVWLSAAEPRQVVTASAKGVAAILPPWHKEVEEAMPFEETPSHPWPSNGVTASDYLLRSLSSGRKHLPMVGDYWTRPHDRK